MAWLSLVLTITVTASTPDVHLTPPAQPEPIISFAPTCNVRGCCQGHGEVAYVQPDKLIICTDGRPSEICDCH